MPFQRKDFQDLFTEMNGLPVIIRLLDPPLHEFLPSSRELLEKMHKLQLQGKEKGSDYAALVGSHSINVVVCGLLVVFVVRCLSFR